MSQYPLSFLIGNPALEALELADVGAADLSPTLDDDAFAGDELTVREIDEMFVAEMERRDAAAAAVFGGDPDGDDDPTPPAGGAVPQPEYADSAARYGDAMLIEAIALADVEPNPLALAGERRQAWLSAMTAEVLRRVAA